MNLLADACDAGSAPKWAGARLVAWLAASRVLPGENTQFNEQLMRLVVRIRAISSGAALVLLVAFSAHTGEQVPVLPIAAIVLALCAASAFGLGRMRGGHPATENDLLGQILFDVGALTLVLRLCSSIETPFDHLFFLPIVLGAYALTGWRMVLVTVLVVAGWIASHHDEPELHHLPEAMEVAAHFVIGALLAYFAYTVAKLSRRHERRLAGMREQEMALMNTEATRALATRTAHTLSTPLGTMAVLLADLRQGRMDMDETEDALEVLANEIATCKRHLNNLLASAGAARGQDGFRADVLQVLREIREECLIHYPQGNVKLSWPDGSGDPPEVAVEMSLFNALAGLAKDFVRMPPHLAQVSAAWDEEGILLRIGGTADDTDPPMRGRRRERLAVISAIVDRHGGRVTVEPGSGRRVTIWLPRTGNRHPN